MDAEYELGRTLQTDLDQLEGHYHERLCGSSRSAGEDRERLVHLGDTKEIPVDLAPLIVGGEFGSTLGGLHEDGSADSTVES